LNDCSYEEVMQALINSLAIVSGIVCDGAKASCAAKIASAVESGLLGYAMCRQGSVF
jgi:L-cysteine desulfidase